MGQRKGPCLAFLLLLIYMSAANIPNDSELQDIFNKTINAQPGKRLSKLLKHILKDYDRKIRPYYGVKPLNVTLDVIIKSFGEIREANMEYVIDIYLGQFWHDHRFALGLNQTYTIGDEFVHEIWTPDTFVVNAIHTQIHKLTKENQKILMNLKDGWTMHTCRLRLTVSCKMNLRDYPKDKQICNIPFESFTYEDFELMYSWRTNETIKIYDDEMAQFTIADVKRELKHEKYHSATFSGLTVTIVFQRRWIYYVYQVYVPCICITVLSWSGFWIDHKAVPARTGLGITTVLTMVYMLASVNSNLPRVTYVKSIDLFVLVCFGFIFFTTIEYVLAVRFSRNRRGSKAKREHLEREEPLEEERTQLSGQVTQSGLHYDKPPSYECNGVNGKGRPPLIRGDSAKSSSLLYSHVVKPRRQTEGRIVTSLRERTAPIHRIVTKVSSHENVIDMASRVLFPLAFLIFNILYWIDFSKK